MIKITFHLFKWENLENWWLTKYILSSLQQMTTQTCGCSYAPCGSALVITLLQKYRLPLSPSNTTPKTGTHSVDAHPQPPSPTFSYDLQPLTISSFTNTQFHPLVYIHSLCFSLLSLVPPAARCAPPARQAQQRTRAEQQSSPAALKREASSSSQCPPRVCLPPDCL